MKGTLYIARLFLFFLFVFAISRVIFLCYFFPQFAHEPFTTILLSFCYALKTDVSATCYLLILPLLLVLFRSVWDIKSTFRIADIYVLTILLINAMVTSADLGLYQEWGVKMNYRAMLYLQRPSEVFSTATNGQIILFFLLTSIQTTLAYYIYRKLIRQTDEWQGQSKPIALISVIILVPLLVLGIRGGMKELPLQASDSYYSTNQTLNWSAVNSLWGLVQSVIVGRSYGLQNPYEFYAKQDAGKTIQDLYSTDPDSTVLFLKNKRPNIVLIIFEGWSTDLIASISQNKERSCTPYFDKLASEGILFTECLASGERSDQGVTAILSSFPSLPLSSIVNYPEKVDQLPSLLKPFTKDGYHSLFLFGGQLSYGNLKSLIYHNGFEKVIEEKDIDPKIYRGRLGVQDEHTFDILHHELNAMKPPFVAGFFTQSTHFSYDYPKAKKPLGWAGAESGYANSLMYADSCLGDFFEKAKREPWFANTLFIMVSDHSHVLPWNDDHSKAALHHIPLLFYGNVIKEEYKGVRKERVVSQQDVPATLLSQLNMSHDNFKWSKDIMNPTSASFAYWTFTDGFGFTCTKDCEFIYDLGNKRVISAPASTYDTLVKRQGFSYLQMVFDDFISNAKRQY